MDNNDVTVLAAFGSVVLIIVVILLAFYLIDAIARYKYLKIRSYSSAWMAFIPIANIWASVEATYGTKERINLYGWEAPAIILKLWAVVTYILATIINVIPGIGNVLSMILWIANIAVMLQIYKDMMERLDNPQEGTGAIVAVIIPIIAAIKIMGAAKAFQHGQQNYMNDERVLKSQTITEGPLSSLNGKI